MALYLFCSNATETLAEQLDAQLKQNAKLNESANRRGSANRKGSAKQNEVPADPLAPPPIVVPNADMAKWLKLTLAAANGVSANLGVTFLDSLLWRMAQNHPDVKERNLERLTQGVLECYILRYFWEAAGPPEAELSPDFAPLQATLENPRSRVELARQLARLFLRYEQERPNLERLTFDRPNFGRPNLERLPSPSGKGLGSRWTRRDFFSGVNPEVRGLENWQREIYRRARALAAKPQDPGDLCYASLPEVFEEWTPSDFQNHAPEKVHLFTPGPLSLFQKSMMEKISTVCEVYLYELTPCLEFWEDLATVKASRKSRKTHTQAAPAGKQRPESRRSERNTNPLQTNIFAGNTSAGNTFAENTFSENLSADPMPSGNLDSPFLAQWGRYHQLNQTHWHGMETTHADYLQGLDLNGTNCLAQVQQSLATGVSPAAYRRDESISFYASPGILREVEWLRHSLVETLHQHPDLTLNHIVVKVPDWKAYQPAISRVFDAYAPGEPEYLPYSVNLYTTAGEYCRGMESLLSLLNGPFSRKTVFEFLQNPLWQRLNGLDYHQVQRWAEWCEALHVYEGFGEDLFAEESDAMDLLHSWKRGFYRLLLGTIAEDTLKSGEETFPENWFPPHAVPDAPGGGSPEDFMGTVESLWRDLQTLKSATTPEAACESLKQFSRLWFPLDTRHAEELYCQNQFHAQLDSMALCFQGAPEPGAHWKVLSPLFQSRLSSYVPAKGNFLTHGILFTQWSAWAPLPASVTYLLGLSDRLSPPEEAAHLDLLRHVPRKEDVTREDLNAAILMEHILCTRKRLCLSYVNQDVKSGEEIAPHRLVEEFRSALGGLGSPPPQVREVPIVSGENETVPPQLWQDHWIGVMREWPASPLPLEDLWHASWPGDHPLWRKLKPLATTLPREDLPNRVSANTVAQKANPVEPDVEDLDMETLARYLRNPLDFHLHNRLGIGDYRESITDRDRPPIKQEFLPEWQWKTEWLEQLVRHAFTPEPERSLNLEHPFRDTFFADQTARGNLPAVPFDGFAEDEMREITAEFTKALEAFREDLGPAVYYPALGFGSHAPQNALVQVPEWEALEVTAEGGTVSLSGILPHVFVPEDPRAPVVALWARPSAFKIHHTLQPYLFDVCRRRHPELQSFFGDRPLVLRALWLENRKLRSAEKLKCGDFSDADAGVLLKNLVEDFMQGGSHFLPVEALYDLYKNKRDYSAENLLAWLMENTRDPAKYRYPWEVSRIARKTIPAPLDTLVEKRFHSLFAALT